MGKADKTDLEAAAQRLELRNADGQDMSYVSCSELDPERRKILATGFPQCAGDGRLAAVIARDSSGALREFVATVKGGGDGGGATSLELVMGCCQITYEDMTPSECVQYAFAEAPEQWAVAQIARGALENYRSMKFEAWRHTLVSGTCEAQLRRMLQIGVVTRLYDDHVFPTPESLQSQYHVIDERNGKTIKLPHPVSALRIWDPATSRYEPIDPALTGAPPENEKESWWEEMLRTLQAQMGADYINSFLKEPLPDRPAENLKL